MPEQNPAFEVCEKVVDNYVYKSTASISPPLCGRDINSLVGCNNICRYSRVGGGGGIQNFCPAVQTLANIDQRLRTLCTLLENFCISLGIEIE